MIEILNYAREWINWLTAWIELILTYWKQIIAVVIVMWLALKIIDLLIAWTSRRKVIATVSRVERVYYPKRLRSMYLVFTDKGVFRNEDSWAFLSFDSSDVYSQIKVGSTYVFTIYGYRFQWGSEYPNIVSVKKENLPTLDT